MMDLKMYSPITEKSKLFDEFFQHINPLQVNQHQIAINPLIGDPLAVCGPMTNDMEILALRNIVLNYIPNGNIIEIGAWLGLSTVTFGICLKERFPGVNRLVYSIDPHDVSHSVSTDATGIFFNSAPAGWDIHFEYLKNIEKWGLDNIIPVRTYSQSAFVDNMIKPISLIFIDGDHSRKAVKDDLVKFIPLVCDGGYILLHDKNNKNVQEAVSDYMCIKNKEYKLVDMIPELLENHTGCDQRGYRDMLYAYRKEVI